MYLRVNKMYSSYNLSYLLTTDSSYFQVDTLSIIEVVLYFSEYLISCVCQRSNATYNNEYSFEQYNSLFTFSHEINHTILTNTNESIEDSYLMKY